MTQMPKSYFSEWTQSFKIEFVEHPFVLAQLFIFRNYTKFKLFLV